MYRKDQTLFQQSIEAIIPTYDHRGNNTCRIIYTEGEDKSVDLNVSKFIQSWFRFFRIDLYAQRMWSWEVLAHRNLNPIILNEHAIFIPVKLRESVGKKDGLYGYIRVSSIEDISCNSILLSSGTEIPYLSSLKTIKIKIMHANLLRYTYLEEFKLQQMIYRKTDDDKPDKEED